VWEDFTRIESKVVDRARPPQPCAQPYPAPGYDRCWDPLFDTGIDGVDRRLVGSRLGGRVAALLGSPFLDVKGLGRSHGRAERVFKPGTACELSRRLAAESAFSESVSAKP
jgi:hypothetical protein